jgi:dihydrodipicolinate synthase/N-acetylneuraminate lyase
LETSFRKTFMPALKGIFVPFAVPLDDEGSINEAELRRYLDWLIERGVHGLYANGSTGEFLRFTPKERRLIVEVTCDTSAGRVPVLAGAAEANVTETLRACETYATFGARAVAVVSPYYYRLGPEVLYAYFHEIGSQSPIDVTLYNIPMFASPLDIATICRLAELERIVGIKDSSGDISFMQRMILEIQPKRPDFSFLTGWDSAIAAMLFVGATGGTLATAGVAPELVLAVYASVTQRQFETAKELQLHLIRLFDAMLNAGEFPSGFRAGVEQRGFTIGRSRQPSCDLGVDSKSRVIRSLHEALAALTQSQYQNIPTAHAAQIAN